MDTTGILATVAGRYLTFQLASERYGIDILSVQEIIGVPKITRVPKCAKSVKGVINLRGRILPIVDLRTKVGLPEIIYDEKTCIVVVNLPTAGQPMSIGIIVDTVLEVINFNSDEIEPAPNYGLQVPGETLIGMARKAQGPLNMLFSIEKVISASDFQSVAVREG